MAGDLVEFLFGAAFGGFSVFTILLLYPKKMKVSGVVKYPVVTAEALRILAGKHPTPEDPLMLDFRLSDVGLERLASELTRCIAEKIRLVINGIELRKEK